MQDCPIWYGERFTKGQAWVDLLLLANHRDKKILFNGEMITIERGQYLTSTVKLADKWGWNRKTVSSYLNMLENEQMITRVSDNLKTLITIENYEVYQGADENDGQPIGQQNGQQSGQQNGQGLDSRVGSEMDSRTDTNKNVKNIKNDNNDKNEKNVKNNIKRFCKPTFEEVDAYCCQRNNTVDAQAFIDFYESKGWKVGNTPMKDWKAAVRTWERGNQRSANNKQQKEPTKWS